MGGQVSVGDSAEGDLSDERVQDARRPRATNAVDGPGSRPIGSLRKRATLNQ